MISFVVPAHNEERCIGATLRALTRAAEGVGEPFELIVADDASTDRTAMAAAEEGARVVQVRKRQIAAARNEGAARASGDLLFFVDADTTANADAVRAAVGAMRGGAVGGGCLFGFSDEPPLWLRAAAPVVMGLLRLLNLSGGCFLFCTREAFDAIGGFDERYYAMEDRPFMLALKRQGRFVVPRERVMTSARKAREMSLWPAMRLLARMTVRGPRGFVQRENCDAWYRRRQL